MAYSAHTIGSLYVSATLRQSRRKAAWAMACGSANSQEVSTSRDRLLLDRIDAEARAAAVRGRDELSAAILADETEAAVVRTQGTAAWAKLADHPLPRARFFPPAGNTDAFGAGFPLWRQSNFP